MFCRPVIHLTAASSIWCGTVSNADEKSRNRQWRSRCDSLACSYIVTVIRRGVAHPPPMMFPNWPARRRWPWCIARSRRRLMVAVIILWRVSSRVMGRYRFSSFAMPIVDPVVNVAG